MNFHTLELSFQIVLIDASIPVRSGSIFFLKLSPRMIINNPFYFYSPSSASRVPRDANSVLNLQRPCVWIKHAVFYGFMSTYHENKY